LKISEHAQKPPADELTAAFRQSVTGGF